MSVAVPRQLPDTSARARWTAWARDAAPGLLVGLITVGAFALRLSQMHQSLFEDEVWTYQDIVGRSLGTVISTVHTGAENSPPLFFIAAWVASKLGDPSVWIRVPSLILGVATVPLVYILGRDTIGRAGGLIGAALLACSPFSIYYGIQARPYAMMAFFVTLSTLALVRAVRSDSTRWWAMYAVAAAGAAYSHYTSVFVLFVQGLWSVWVCRDRLRKLLIANGSVIAMYLPWLPHVRGKSLGVFSTFTPLTAHLVAIDVPRPVVGYPYAALSAIPGVWGAAVIGAALAVGSLALLRRAASARPAMPASSESGRRWVLLLAALAAATPVGVLLWSLVGTDIWSPRGLYASVPAAVLALGALLAAPPRWIRAAAGAAVLITLMIGTVRAISPRYARPPFRTAAQYLDRVAGARDPIILYPFLFGLSEAIPAQLKRPHMVITSAPKRWPTPPAGGHVYVVLDDVLMRALRAPTPHPRGFRLSAIRHYTGLSKFTLAIYQTVGSNR